MINPDSHVVVFLLTSGQFIIAAAKCDPYDRIQGDLVMHPYEMVAIPPTAANSAPSFAMTPFGSFYGMLTSPKVLYLEPSKYYHRTLLTEDNPLRQFYIESVNSKKIEQ